MTGAIVKNCSSGLTTALAVVALLAPSQAVAAVTVGSDLSSSSGSADCGDSNCTIAQTALPGRVAAVPYDGVIVRWRVRDSAGSLRLRVMRPGDAGVYTAVARSGSVSVSSPDVTTFEARVPVKAGDYIAIDLNSATSSALGYRTVSGATDATWVPRLNDNEGRPPSETGTDEDLYNADVEPDADGDGFGDETQDACPTNKTTQLPCTDLSLTAAAASSVPFFGDPVAVTLTVTNNGPIAADGVWVPTIGGTQPRGQQVLVSAIASQGTCTAPTAAPGAPGGLGIAGRCDLGSLAPGQSATATVSVAYFQARPFHDEVVVSSATPEANPANNATAIDIVVKTRPGTCTNKQNGTDAAERPFVGTRAGDLLHALGGDDLVVGLGGADCIFGGAGADKLDGGPGNDKLYGEAGDDYLIGGDGRDVLVGGPGKNRYSAGAGNDTINSRNRTAELVSCGAGVDKVTADKADRLSGCELKSVK